MKQINDIPVRRRPQSKDVHPSNSGAETRQRRQIWELEFDASKEVQPKGPVSDLPEPKPARPRSTPLILTPSSRNAGETAPKRADAAEPVDAPATAAAAQPAASRIEPLAAADVPQKRTVSRPRAAEPPVDAGPTDAKDRAHASSLRQRSRPIMAPSEPAQAPQPPAGQNARVNRAKTRILGFHAPDVAPDPLSGEALAQPSGGHAGQFPAGWFVITAGPGRGASFTIGTGVSTIGRGADQSISLDFGDQSVSRSAHASVAYDEEQNKFFIGHGGKSNVVRRNGAPVLATEEMTHGDTIRIGKTTLKFVAFCGADFTWADHGGMGSEVENG